MKTLLAGAHLLKLEKIIQQSDAITVVMSSRQVAAACPSCQIIASKIHSRYERKLADLPWQGIAVRIRLQVRKFFCHNEECQQRIFCERLPEVADRYAHRTQRLNVCLRAMGFALGGRAGARIAPRLGIRTGVDSILRRLRAAATQSSNELKVWVLGVDDWALKKGQHYGTILVDLEQRRPIDLLRGREANPLKEWLKGHPEIEIITRDRSGAYADGSQQGAPQAQQVADRWHLLKNCNEAFEKVLKRHQKLIREAIEKIPVPAEVLPSNDQPPIVLPTASEYMRSRAEKERRQSFHRERKFRDDRVQELKQEGFSILQIKTHLGCGYTTVANFFQADEYPVIRRGRGRSGLNEFDAELRQRWESGCHNARQLYQEICEKGDRGSELTVRRHVQLWRQQDVKTLPPKPRTFAIPGSRTCVWLLLKGKQSLGEEERLVQSAILDASPVIQQGLELAKLFREAFSSRSEKRLETWLEKATQSQLPEFENFVLVLRRDEAAVRAAISSTWSNGQTEGQVNRLKTLKRQMYGRANFDLLRAPVLNPC